MFTNLNWNIPKSITVTAIDDSTIEGSHSQIITHTATSSDGAYNNIAVQNNTLTITDNDFAPVSSGGGGGGGGGSSGGNGIVINPYYVAPVQTQYLTSTTSGSTTNTIQVSNKSFDPNKEYGKLISRLAIDPNVPKAYQNIVCKKFLKSYINLGANNNKEDVIRLQLFLNEKEGENLIVDGIYKKVDVDAVNRFQSKYQEQILFPWGNKYPTGNVNRTTVAKINAVSCADASLTACPYFTSYLKRGDNSDAVVKLQDFLNLISAPISGYPNVAVKLSGTFDTNTYDAVKSFQSVYKDTVLKPWSLSQPSGWFYKTSVLAAHQLMNCDVKSSEIYGVNYKTLNNPIATSTIVAPTIKKEDKKIETVSLPQDYCFEYKETLKGGNVNYGVYKMQETLKYLGFYGGKVNGNFGKETRAAVLDFQKTYGLRVTGEVGPLTAAKLTSLTCGL